MKRLLKPRTYKTARKAAWDAFSLFVRARDCLKTTKTLERGRCYTCNHEFPFKKLQAGHFVAGRGISVLFDEAGVKIQCFACNIMRGGEPLLYRRKLVEEYGEEFVRTLEDKRWIKKKLKVFELDCLRLYYQRETQKMIEMNPPHKEMRY